MTTEMNKAIVLDEKMALQIFKKRKKSPSIEDINNIIVHNIRGIASNIKMLVEVLLKTHVYKDEQSYKLARTFSLEQGLTYIGDSSSSLIDTLNELMKGVEATDTTAHEEATEVCDISQMVADISVQLNGFVHEKNATIAVDLAVTHIDYPKCYLESLLYNLISNSLKYSQPDVPVNITVATREEDGKTILSVKDNGLGIDLEKHGDKIFSLGQVFHQGYDSKGLGLYITKKQIEAAGGTITVQSKVNEGCEFIVTF
ncbi:MAG: sensor histidine kinase [Bacteroidota bacterium]